MGDKGWSERGELDGSFLPTNGGPRSAYQAAHQLLQISARAKLENEAKVLRSVCVWGGVGEVGQNSNGGVGCRRRYSGRWVVLPTSGVSNTSTSCTI